MKNGLHRYANGHKEWYHNGVRHRTDGPAFEWASGSKAWFLNGVLHRTDGPACEYADGSKSWFLNGKPHRTDGPAVEYADGYKAWYLNGVLHRTDGPAFESIDGYKTWYLNGTKLSEDLFLKVTKGPVKNLPLYLGLCRGMGVDQYISERMKHDSVVPERNTVNQRPLPEINQKSC
jgi:hypothetical protein